MINQKTKKKKKKKKTNSSWDEQIWKTDEIIKKITTEQGDTHSGLSIHQRRLSSCASTDFDTRLMRHTSFTEVSYFIS